MSELFVTKRSGQKELIDLEKIHRVTEEACADLSGVSPSEVEMKSQIQFYDGIKTSDIQEVIIKAAADLISEDNPNYQHVAGRLVSYHLRKQVYGSYTPPSLYDHVLKTAYIGAYDKDLLTYYTEEEWNDMNDYIDHSRDDELTYVAMEQFRSKYLVKDRLSGEIFETPQMAYMLIAATFFHTYPSHTRMDYVKEYYDMISTHVITLATPIMAGVRTPDHQFSSCTLIDVADDLNSITASADAVVKHISNRAGIGLNVGRIRAEGSSIRNGAATHTGLIPFIKFFQAATKSCSQGGIRGGSSTINFMIWHRDIEDLIVLKNNKGTDDNRARHVDYCVQINKLFYERLITGGNITLFSPNDVPGLYEAFFTNQDEFKRLYEKAEKNQKIVKKVVKAIDLFSKIMTERKETGRIYIMNVDHANTHGGFDPEQAAVYMTNLCVEILIHTKPIYDRNDLENEIALCILSGINLGKIRKPSDFKRPCELAVRALNQLIDIQDYLLPASRKSATERRPIGIGFINLAYWLAKNDIPYDNVSKEQLQKVHEMVEAFSYYILKASNDLAKELGPCVKNSETKYSKGILPVHTYKKELDEIVDPIYHFDWDQLSTDFAEYGTMNSTHMAQFPSETSSQIANGTNGCEPARALVTSKQSKDGIMKQVVPEIRKLKHKYNLLWDQKSPEGYLKICAVIQKFFDQSMSVNTSYNPKHYHNEEIPMSVMLKDMLMAYKLGLTSLYYYNTFKGEIIEEKKEVAEEEDCSACKL